MKYKNIFEKIMGQIKSLKNEKKFLTNKIEYFMKNFISIYHIIRN